MERKEAKVLAKTSTKWLKKSARRVKCCFLVVASAIDSRDENSLSSGAARRIYLFCGVKAVVFHLRRTNEMCDESFHCKHTEFNWKCFCDSSNFPLPNLNCRSAEQERKTHLRCCLCFFIAFSGDI